MFLTITGFSVRMFLIRTENPVGARSAQDRLSDATVFMTPYMGPIPIVVYEVTSGFGFVGLNIVRFTSIFARGTRSAVRGHPGDSLVPNFPAKFDWLMDLSAVFVLMRECTPELAHHRTRYESQYGN